MRKIRITVIVAFILITGLNATTLANSFTKNLANIEAITACGSGKAESQVYQREIDVQDWSAAWSQFIKARCLGDEDRVKAASFSLLKISDERLNLIRRAHPYDLELANFASTHYPGSAETNFWLGDALKQSGQIEAAMVVYEIGLTLDETDGDAWFALGQLYGEHRTWEQAALAFEHSCTYPDKGKNGCHQAGILYYENGSYEIAVDRFEKSLRIIGEGWLRSQKGLADSLLALGRVEQAIPHLEMLAERGDGDAQKLLDELR